MTTLIRYLSNEAIENCVLCLNYCFDRVIFYSYIKTKEEEEKNITSFLSKECNIKKIQYITINNNNLEELINNIKTIVKKERCFFDITGCEGICQVAFNKIAIENAVPMYIYDVRNKELLGLNKCDYDIGDVIKQKIDINIEKYICMVGGIILKNMQKDNKSKTDKEVFNKLKMIKKKYDSIWASFSHCMQQCQTKNNNNNLEARCHDISRLTNHQINVKELLAILNDLKENKLINRYSQIRNEFVFVYANEEIMNSILESGSIFEIEVFEHEKIDSDDCAIGIHLDWDGIVGKTTDGNVINEVDVLRLDGYELTFISCKDTKKIDKNSLYELETIARRFGGKYSKMKLVTKCEVSKTDKERAKLIGIEVVNENEY